MALWARRRPPWRAFQSFDGAPPGHECKAKSNSSYLETSLFGDVDLDHATLVHGQRNGPEAKSRQCFADAFNAQFDGLGRIGFLGIAYVRHSAPPLSEMGAALW